MRGPCWDFVASIVLSVLGFFVFSEIYRVLRDYGIDLGFGGDKSQVFFGLYIGLPLGSVIGTWAFERIVCGVPRWNIAGAVLVLALSLPSIYAGLALMDKFGSEAIFAIPLLMSGVTVLGYRIGLLV